MYEVKQKFKEYALSYAGVCGGNPKSRYWFCGIEWGGTDSSLDDLEPITEILPYKNTEEAQESPVNLSIAKIMCAIEENNRDPKEFRNSSDFCGKNMFKMNLYPLSFPTSEDKCWKERHHLYTGFPTKKLYRDWCQTFRFPIFKEWLKAGDPKIVLGFGKNWANNFVLAFIGDAQSSNKYLVEEKEEGLPSGKSVKIIKLAPGNANNIDSLILTPFLGRGLMADPDLKCLGEIIGKLP